MAIQGLKSAKFYHPSPRRGSPRLKFLPLAPAGVSPRQKILTPPPAGVLPRLIFVTPPPAGVKPRQTLFTLTPAGVSPRLAFLTPTPAGADPGRGQPRRGRGFPGLNPGPRKTLYITLKCIAYIVLGIFTNQFTMSFDHYNTIHLGFEFHQFLGVFSFLTTDQTFKF